MIITYLYKEKDTGQVMVLERDSIKRVERFIYNTDKDCDKKWFTWQKCDFETMEEERREWDYMYTITRIPRDQVEKFVFLATL